MLVLGFSHRRFFGTLALINENFLSIYCYLLSDFYSLIVTSELKVLAINVCKIKLICVKIKPLFIFPPLPYTVGGVNI